MTSSRFPMTREWHALTRRFVRVFPVEATLCVITSFMFVRHSHSQYSLFEAKTFSSWYLSQFHPSNRRLQGWTNLSSTKAKKESWAGDKNTGTVINGLFVFTTNPPTPISWISSLYHIQQIGRFPKTIVLPAPLGRLTHPLSLLTHLIPLSHPHICNPYIL